MFLFFVERNFLTKKRNNAAAPAAPAA